LQGAAQFQMRELDYAEYAQCLYAIGMPRNQCLTPVVWMLKVEGLDHLPDDPMIVDDNVIGVAALCVAEIGPEVPKRRSGEVGREIVGDILRHAPGAEKAILDRVGEDDVLQEAFVETVLLPVVLVPEWLEGRGPVIGRDRPDSWRATVSWQRLRRLATAPSLSCPLAATRARVLRSTLLALPRSMVQRSSARLRWLICSVKPR
jgi:hypothetical protein